MLVLLGVWLFGNYMNSMLKGTGAFEIIFNNELLYSKLETGEFPESNLIYQRLVSFFN